ncbi:MAG TPA: chemotaxis protein CheW [Armatimonadota bacterium]|nr:chemotaxis protein CheW [Armatimonadota bacterium]HQK96007.1 chemotaxis protein CheW [Armatimonadota bacterium]
MFEGAKEVQLVVFGLADESYGVHVLAVEEIIRLQEITAIPHAPDFVEGVINLRGRVIPVLDLRKRFGLPPAEATKSTRIVVVEASGMTVGLVVDSVDEVRNLPTDTIEPPSPIVTTVDSDFLMGVGKLPAGGGQEQLVILLDLDRVTSVAERQALSALGAGEEAAALPSGN